MNDFFQSLSFNSVVRSSDRQIAGAGGLTPAAAPAPLRCIMQSFDELPFTAFRPTPTAPARRRRRKALNSQPSTLNRA